MKLSNISHSQLSIVRHYGACIINGQKYIYNPITDELILDVKVKKQKRQENNQTKLL